MFPLLAQQDTDADAVPPPLMLVRHSKAHKRHSNSGVTYRTRPGVCPAFWHVHTGPPLECPEPWLGTLCVQGHWPAEERSFPTSLLGFVEVSASQTLQEAHRSALNLKHALNMAASNHKMIVCKCNKLLYKAEEKYLLLAACQGPCSSRQPPAESWHQPEDLACALSP